MIPQMEKAGYPRVFATNVTIAGSVQAILIPPSHNAVIYALAVGGSVSIGHLLVAGFLPGLLLGWLAGCPGADHLVQGRLPESARRSRSVRPSRRRSRRCGAW